MSAYLILEAEFKTKKDRLDFEKLLKKEYIYFRHISDYYKDKDFEEEALYDLQCQGYAIPEMMLEKALKKKIKVVFMAWIPISDRQSEWTKIRGRW